MNLPLRAIAGLPLLLAPGLLVAASAPVVAEMEPLRAGIARATAEARAADAEVRRLEHLAQAAGDQAERLRARQAAAAEAIAAAEARISAADARARLIAAMLDERSRRLAEEQAPAGSLLAGLALMASRPPVLSIVDKGSTEEFVRVRLLLDSTLPVIRRRTAALRSEIERGVELQEAVQAARAAAARSRSELAERQREFAALEQQALRTEELRSGQALGAGDVAMARSEEADRLERLAGRSRNAALIASELAALPTPPPRPGAVARMAPTDGAPAYLLPSSAPVVEGLGTVAPNGVRSRGIALATARGARLAVPATGIVRFSGPFRSYDGIVIIDHGNGWTTLIVNLSSPLKPGQRVRIGEPLGRALGRIEVELSHKGTRHSAALIAGSSESLSNRRQQG